MGFYGRSNAALIEAELATGIFRNHQVAGCDLENLRVCDARITGSDFSELQANGIAFVRAGISGTRFSMNNMSGSAFDLCEIDDAVFEGINFIKTKWNASDVRRSTIRGCAMQRLAISGTGFYGCTVADVEALAGTVSDCVFSGCIFEIGYGSGMNGFGDTLFARCIFHNCRFEGFPLRGARLEHCLFSRCTGEIGDGIDALDVAGLGHPAFWHSGRKDLSDRSAAEDLIRRASAIIKERGRRA